jgi:transmembrane sensor
VTDASDAPDPTQQQLREIRAQAAVWVTDLHGPNRTAELEASLRLWLAEDPRHAQAFELATDAWSDTEHLPLSFAPNLGRKATRFTRARIAALIGAAALSITLAAIFYALSDPTLSTGAAEQRTVDLADGTQVTLNANSRISTNFTDKTRQLTLDKGEVLFTVTHDPNRPFIVNIGERKVTAVGTIFDIRREDARRDDFTVTLIEGRVAIAPLSPSPAADNQTVPANMQLQPGQRLRVSTQSPDALDTPPIEKITAWQRGMLVFDDTPLRNAAAEFNRYGKRKLIIDSTVSNNIHVSGVFKLNDPLSFAQAIAKAHQLRISENPNEITLTAP